MRTSSMTARIGIVAWLGLPAMVSVLGLLIYVAPVHVFGRSVPMPLFPLMALFFWSMARPQLMPPLAVFLIGLLQDFLTGGPVGLWAMAYLLTFTVMATQRETFAGRGQFALIVGFVLAVLCAFGFAWIIARISLGPGVVTGRFFTEAGLSILVFPLVGRLFGGLQRMTSQARRLSVHHAMTRRL